MMNFVREMALSDSATSTAGRLKLSSAPVSYSHDCQSHTPDGCGALAALYV
jgi:hypothetical protein